jgi:hypothetical protein
MIGIGAMLKRVTIEPQLNWGLAIAFAQGLVEVLIQIGARFYGTGLMIKSPIETTNKN